MPGRSPRGSRASQGFFFTEGDEAFFLQGPQGGEGVADFPQFGDAGPAPSCLDGHEGQPLTIRELHRVRRGFPECCDPFRPALHGGFPHPLLQGDDSPFLQPAQLVQERFFPQLFLEAAQGHSRRTASQRVDDGFLQGSEIARIAALYGPQQAFDVDAPGEDLAEGPARGVK